MKHPEYVLAAALVCCAPMARGILSGQIGAATAGERFLVALVVCWVLGSVLSRVYTGYSVSAQKAQIMRMIEAERVAVDTTAEPTPGREPGGK